MKNKKTKGPLPNEQDTGQQPVNVPDKESNAENEQLATNIIDQNTNDPSPMEVHHPHHPSHKKKWTEYLLEFLMLFLAVFLGFTAENIREHNIERHREKEYVTGIVQNLKDDTASMRRVLPYFELRYKLLDSIVKMSKDDLTARENLKRISRLALTVAYYNRFNANTATIAQLKAGNLRLIQKNHAADSILRYDLLNERTETQWNVFYSMFTKYIDATQNLFDITIMLDSSFKYNEPFDNPPPLLSSDRKIRQSYFNSAVAYYITSDGYKQLLDVQLRYAERLLTFLKKEYDLDDE